MTSKILLKSARTCLLHLNERQEEVERLRSTLLPSGIRYDRESVQTSPDGGMLSDTLCKIMEIESELDRERNTAAHTVNKAVKLIGRLEKPEHRELLRLRYISCRSWAQIAMQMNYSESMVYKIHGLALREADEHYSEL